MTNPINSIKRTIKVNKFLKKLDREIERYERRLDDLKCTFLCAEDEELLVQINQLIVNVNQKLDDLVASREATKRTGICVVCETIK